MRRTRILRVHYFGLARRALGRTALVLGLLMSLGMAPAVQAAGLSSRSASLSISAPSSTSDNVTFSFTFASSYTVRGIDFRVCTSPVQVITCTVPTGATFASASTTLGSTSGGCSGFAYSSESATDYKITNAGGNAVTSSSTCSVTVNGLTNPSAANSEFYLRAITFTDTGFSLPSASGQDFGAMAVSTGTTLNVSTLVQESLVLQAGTSGNCTGGLSGTTVYIGGSSSAVLSSTAANVGTSLICVTTNASSGYTLQYISNSGHGAGGAFTNYTGTTHDFHDYATGTLFNGTNGTNSGAQDFFGINLRQNTGASGDLAGGNDPSGGVSPTLPAAYGTPDSWAFARASATQVASETTGATDYTTFTVSYEAQGAPNTPPGQYEVTMDYIATGTF